LTRLITIQMK